MGFCGAEISISGPFSYPTGGGNTEGSGVGASVGGWWRNCLIFNVSVGSVGHYSVNLLACLPVFRDSRPASRGILSGPDVEENHS
jgi:hypothetical protein